VQLSSLRHTTSLAVLTTDQFGTAPEIELRHGSLDEILIILASSQKVRL
jgi:hypothetical protein